MTGPMRGPLKVAAAFACLLALAACGGGGGGSVAGGGNGGPGSGNGGGGGGNGGGGNPTPMQPAPWFLEQNAAAVTTFNNAIDAHTPNQGTSSLGSSRAADGIGYRITVTSEEGLGITYGGFSQSSPQTALEPERQDGNVYIYRQPYVSGGENYEGILLLSYDPDPELTGTEAHYWGMWLRKKTAADGTVTWDDFRTANNTNYDVLDGNNIAGLEDSFSYAGKALGVYTRAGTSAGWFSADTALTIAYGGTDIAEADRFKMTGTIDNFVLSGRETTSWSVTVTAEPGKTNGVPDASAEWTGTTAGGGGAGTLNARVAGTLGEVPDWFLAQFNAHFTDGKVAGVFTAARGN